MKKILDYLKGCGYSEAEANKEAEAMIKYHTTRLDAFSREHAIEMIVEDIDCFFILYLLRG